MLKGFKIDINKIVRLKLYKWGLVEIILLISSYGWRDVITKKVWSKKPKLGNVMRFPAQINPISDWSKISIWGTSRRFLTKINPISG
jgi:hypothetical protein